MKYLLITLLLISIVLSAHAELNQDDLNKIRLLIVESETRLKSEITSTKEELKTEIASVKEDVANLKGRIDGIEKLITWFIVIIVALFGIPQLIVLKNKYKLHKIRDRRAL